MTKKYLIIVLLLNPISIYADYYSNNYWKNKNRMQNRELNLKNKEINLKHKQYLDRKRANEELRDKRETERRNNKARNANERYYRELKYKNRHNNYNSKHNYVKKVYNPKNFKNKPQLKIDELHILGITSIKNFKNNKIIIKAKNGTFALAKEKFYKAEKINFKNKLSKWNIYK